MTTLRAVLFSFCLAGTVTAQHPISERVVLPADKADTEVTLILPVEPATTAKANVLPLLDRGNAPLPVQPVIGDLVLSGNTLKIRLSGIYFWGEAKLPVQMIPGQLYNYTLQRGPTLAASDVHVERGRLADIWLYNFDTQPLHIRWRIISGADSVCGLDSDMQPRGDCASPDHWPEATLGPARSDPLVFAASDSWFNLWAQSEFRQAELELRFGADNASPLARLPLRLHLDDPSYPTVQFASHLLRVIFWVTLGAAFLMLAQVMIPNFRRCLEMESQIESLQQDLRAIDSSVGSRLYSRCQQGINSVRRGLAMRERIAQSGWKSISSSVLRVWYRFALAGNTTEVDRLGAILPRIESRIRLTARLDERDSAIGSDYAQIPPSFCWNREQQLLAVQEILAGKSLPTPTKLTPLVSSINWPTTRRR
jgi:hypothetical protein